MRSRKSLQTTAAPEVPRRWLLPFEWLGALGYMIYNGGLKIVGDPEEKIEGPCLVLSNHASYVDFAVALKAVFPHRSNWVAAIDEFVGREWLLRKAGGIYKRKFTAELSLVKHIFTVLKKRRGILVMYPEARYALAGVNERISGAIGKLVKKMDCGVFVLIEHGNFISRPQWGSGLPHPVPVVTEKRRIVTAEEAKTLTSEEIERRIAEALRYDDYRWQLENRVAVHSGRRAEGLHRILYQCAACGREFTTESSGTRLRCTACNAEWEMSVYGQLFRLNGEDRFTHIPDWYNWERENVNREVESGTYLFEDEARLEHLHSGSRGFKCMGTVRLRHDYEGFTLEGTLDSGEPFRLFRSAASMESVHIEYDLHKRGVKERGPAIDLCTLTDTYFAFLLTKKNPLTKIHFAQEALYDRAMREISE